MTKATPQHRDTQSEHGNVVEFAIAGQNGAEAEEIARRKQEAEDYARGADAAATIETYERGVNRYRKWCEETGRDFPLDRKQPCPPEDVVAFIKDMSASLKPATIETYVAALDRKHRDAGFATPSDANLVRKAKRAMKRAQGTAQKQAPALSAEVITVALDKMGNTLAELRDKALIWLAYDSMARASEIIAFNVSDLHQSDRGHAIHIAKSKTDQEGEGDYRYVSPQTMRAINDWVEAAALDADSALFIPVSQAGKSDRLARQDIGRIYKRRIGQKYSAHSTRVGAAVDQLYWKETTARIMQAGGWKSPVMVARYTKSADVQNSAAAGLARKQGRI